MPRHSILIIDDDETDVMFLKQAFQEAEDLDVHHASTGEAGLEFIRDHAPDLVLLDLKMPGTSGFDVLSSIRLDEATKRTRVVVMSSSSSQDDVRASYEGAANAYVTKPDTIGGYRKVAESLERFWIHGAVRAD